MVRLDSAVPARVFRGVGIGAGNDGVISTGHTVITAVLPAEIPCTDCGGAVIGNFDRGGEPVTPLTGYLILASGLSLDGERR